MITLLNDLHLGVSRAGGTTPQSATCLRDWIRLSLIEFIGPVRGHLVINGDLFDGFSVDVSEVLDTWMLFATWLSDIDTRSLTLIAGNHDHSPKADKVSSFSFLSQLLKHSFPDQVDVIAVGDGLKQVTPYAYAIPHCPNQDLFNLELQKAADTLSNCYLLLHANYDNRFTENSDHSLNVSVDQTESLRAKGVVCVFAHEHQRRQARVRKVSDDPFDQPEMTQSWVYVCGNQWPSSVADCLGGMSDGQKDGKKYAHRLHDDLTIEPIETCDMSQVFTRVDWRSLQDYNGDHFFIRVEGEATTNEAADVVTALAKFRSKDSAFVITNNVRVEGFEEMDELPSSFEEVKRFDVLGFLFEQLTADQQAVVKALLPEVNDGK